MLFMEMRLGKTLVTVRGARACGYQKILVLAPYSAVNSWVHELTQEYEPFTLVEGSRAKRVNTLRQAMVSAKYSWVLTNPTIWRSVPEIAGVDWDLVIFDESASYIRNPKAKITKWSRKFRPGPRAILAGNPDPQERLYDYYPQVSWAESGPWLGAKDHWTFLNRFFVKRGFRWYPRDRTEDRIKRDLAERAFVLLRKDALDVPKTLVKRIVPLPPALRRVYTRAEDEYVLDLGGGEEKQTKWTVARYTWLRQIASGFVDHIARGQHKTAELLELAFGELHREPLVICCNTHDEISESTRALTEEGRGVLQIHGRMQPSQQRKNAIAFQEGVVNTLVAQTDSIATGTDLDRADTIIYYSPPLSVLAWTQSQSRILGALEKRGAQIISLLGEDTVEEDIYHAITKKEKGSRGFLGDIRDASLARRGGAAYLH